MRFVRFDWIVMAIASAGIEGITHPTEILEPGEVLRHRALRLSLHGRSGRRRTVLGHTATIRSTHGRRTVTTLLRSGRCAALTAILGSGGSAIAVAGASFSDWPFFLLPVKQNLMSSEIMMG